MNAANPTLAVRLHAVSYAAAGINFYELQPLGGQPLPAFSAGAHIDLHLADGLVRQYSLCNGQDERHRYVVGVKHDPGSRGGSRWIHEQLRVGTLVTISEPRNNFALVEDADASVLIAGGIGVTPMASMVARLCALGRDWTLHYSVRCREDAVACAALNDRRVHLHVDAEQGGARLDIAALVRAAPPQAHLYCCGPSPMLAGFQAAARHLPPEQVHLEHFGAVQEAAAAGGFLLELARSGRRIQVCPGQTIMQALRSAGVAVQTSCEQGVCGVCETRVLAGIPDHRDVLLSEQEKASNTVMMICCSGSRGELLVLDL